MGGEEKKTGNSRIVQRVQYTPFSMDKAKRYFYRILTDFEPDYQCTKFNESLIINLINYAHGVDGEFDPCKSVAFIGPTGTGKTLTMRALISYMMIDCVRCLKNGRVIPFYPTDFSSIRKIVSTYSLKGYDGLNGYLKRFSIVIDEVGAEPIVSKYYGNEINVFGELIEERYLFGNITNFTSNCDVDEIRDRYGERVYSRLKETANIVEFIDKDWRLNK